jgi:hypothetical protein
VNAERERKSIVDSVYLRGRKCPYKIGERTLGQTNQFIAMNAAVVLQAFFDTNRNLRGESVIYRVDRCAYDGRVARIDGRLTTHHDENPRALRVDR